MDNVREPFPWGAFWLGFGIALVVIAGMSVAADAGWGFADRDPDADCPLTDAALAAGQRLANIGQECVRSLENTAGELSACRDNENERVATEGWASCVTFSKGLLTELQTCVAKKGTLASYSNPDECPKFYQALLLDLRYCYDNAHIPNAGDAFLEGCVYSVLANRGWGWPRKNAP